MSFFLAQVMSFSFSTLYIALININILICWSHQGIYIPFDIESKTEFKLPRGQQLAWRNIGNTVSLEQCEESRFCLRKQIFTCEEEYIGSPSITGGLSLPPDDDLLTKLRSINEYQCRHDMVMQVVDS